MMNTQAEDLFARARELEAGERETFLSGNCGDDSELRSAVELLLEDAEKAAEFFGVSDDATIAMDGSGKTSGKVISPSGINETGSVHSFVEKEGDKIGPYKLLQLIGEGGFGVVFKAEQIEPIQRMVAIKIIKPGMDTQEVIARFEIERQALAMMDHPNIASVLDAGTTNAGRPYFVMELVKGDLVTDYCDSNHLNTNHRLALFQDICSAVQHAHQKGVIHRDLKPSNILVALHDDRPVVKVIDFGVAKAINQDLTDKTLYTAIGQMIGTPQYMSPEQSATRGIDIDTRSDIYSLGVVLYELLTGTTPIDIKKIQEAGVEEIYRLIREEEALKPSTQLSLLSSEESITMAEMCNTNPDKLNRQLRGDLDWVVMKALEKERDRRYESATEFAADIQQYLSDEPVRARPPSASYRLRKFIRRNRVVLTTVSLVFAVLIVGTVISTLQTIRAMREAVRATKAEAVAEEERVLAQESAAESKAVLEFFKNKVLAAARPKLLGGGQGVDTTIREAINAAEPQIGEAFADQPLIEASVRHDLGYTYSYLGEYKSAIAQRERALELRKKGLGSEHPVTLATMDSLAYSYAAAGHHEKALNLGKMTLELKKKVMGSEHPDTLLAMAMVAGYYRNLGRFQEALALNEESLKLKKKILGSENANILQAMGSLANSYRDVGRLDEALALHEETLKLKQKQLGHEHPATLSSMASLAYTYSLVGRSKESLNLKKDTFSLMKKVMGYDHPATLKSMISLAAAYEKEGRHQEAQDLKREEKALRDKK